MKDTNIEKLRNFQIKRGTIEAIDRIEAVTVPEPNPLKIRIYDPGVYYRVTLSLFPSEHSHIVVVVCLPEPTLWNGKFLGTGNGGYAGNISEGALLGGISRGYATANTDLGTGKYPDRIVRFKDVWMDFGHRATHLMTEVGKDLTEWFYGKRPRYSYFIGGSTGGQQGFSEAQRYPKDYDGIICLSPAFDRVRLHAWFLWNWQQIHKEKDAVFTKEQAQSWKECILRAYCEVCGGRHGDNFLTRPDRITVNPMDHPALKKEAKKLLTEGQRKALRSLYDGPKDPVTGEQFAAAFLPGTEAESLSLTAISDKEFFDWEFFYPFRWAFGKDFDPIHFDFHRDLEEVIEILSPILDADNPDLDPFKKAGGKLLVIGGSSDAIIPYTGFLNYLNKVVEKQGGLDETKAFFRFILMPGFAHTIGGCGVQEVGALGITEVPRDAQHDVICAMEQWVEKDVAPETMKGTHFKLEEEGLKFAYDLSAHVYPHLSGTEGGENDGKL